MSTDEEQLVNLTVEEEIDSSSDSTENDDEKEEMNRLLEEAYDHYLFESRHSFMKERQYTVHYEIVKYIIKKIESGKFNNIKFKKS